MSEIHSNTEGVYPRLTKLLANSWLGGRERRVMGQSAGARGCYCQTVRGRAVAAASDLLFTQAAGSWIERASTRVIEVLIWFYEYIHTLQLILIDAHYNNWTVLSRSIVFELVHTTSNVFLTSRYILINESVDTYWSPVQNYVRNRHISYAFTFALTHSPLPAGCQPRFPARFPPETRREEREQRRETREPRQRKEFWELLANLVVFSRYRVFLKW